MLRYKEAYRDEFLNFRLPASEAIDDFFARDLGYPRTIVLGVFVDWDRVHPHDVSDLPVSDAVAHYMLPTDKRLTMAQNPRPCLLCDIHNTSSTLFSCTRPLRKLLTYHHRRMEDPMLFSLRISQLLHGYQRPINHPSRKLGLHVLQQFHIPGRRSFLLIHTATHGGLDTVAPNQEVACRSRAVGKFEHDAV